MKRLLFSYKKSCRISHDDLEVIAQRLVPEMQRIKDARLQGYDSVYASINLPSDEELRNQVDKLVEKKKRLKISALVVVGIGGSNLGTMAIHHALYGMFYNEQNPDVKIYWADTVDSDYMLDIILLLEQELHAGKEILINVVSKSGTTTETIANFELLVDILKRNRPHTYRDFIVATTDENSPLWNLAGEEGFERLAIPSQVGGRYSVLSAVGLFPLAFCGVDIKKLQAGAQDMVDRCISNDFFENPAALSAAILYLNYKKGMYINDMFLFSHDLQSLGMWYRQLLAESIGKEYDREGNKINVGITPLVSIGSIDLHSMVQLRLGGPNNTFTTFVAVEKNKSNIPMPCLEKYEKLVAHVQCKPLSSIMDAIFKGVERAYEEKEKSFVSIMIPEKDAWSIGQFLQMNMIAILYLGYLFDVNPFDQPEVERYKRQTREILAHE